MLKAGKRTKKWNKVRRTLKQEFYAAGITTCELRLEGCWINEALSFAHLKKRRNFDCENDWFHTVLACCICHQKVEFLGEEKMSEVLSKVIEQRQTRVLEEIF